MLGGVIAEFLAKVGFEADATSLDRAMGVVKGFAVSVGAVAAGAVAGILHIARSYDDLGRAGARLGVPVARLQELRYVAEQTGTGANALMSSLDGIRSRYPHLRDAGAALEQAGRQMRGMSRAAQEAYAARMGIDPDLIPMLTSDVAGLRAEWADLYATAGTDADAAAVSARGLLAEVDKLRTMALAVAHAVAAGLFDRLRQDAERLRRGVAENFDRIKKVLAGVITFALRVVGAVAAFGGRIIDWLMRVVDWFDRLDSTQQRAILVAGALLAAWRLLNLGFLATPLGAIIAGLVAIIALVDDFLTYLEGGQSLIDWGPWAADILAVADALRPLITLLLAGLGGALRAIGPLVATQMSVLTSLLRVIGQVGRLIWAVLTGDLSAALDAAGEIWRGWADMAGAIMRGLTTGLAVLFHALWDGVASALPDFAAWATGAAEAITSILGSALDWLTRQLDRVLGLLPAGLAERLNLGGGGLGEEREARPGGNGTALIGTEGRTAPPDLATPALTPSPAQVLHLEQQARPSAPYAGAGPVTIQQQTDIHVTTTGDAQAAARAVARGQGDVNAQMVRHARGVVR